MFLKRSSHDKLPLLDVCYSLNVAAANTGGQGSAEQEGAGDERGRKTHEWDQACGGIGFFFCQLRCGLRCSQEVCGTASCGVKQQTLAEQRSSLERDLKALLLKASKTGKLSLVDIAWFLTLQVGHASGGWFCKDDIASNIVDKLIGELPDSSAAASTLAMGFVVAIFFCAWLLQCRLEWDMCFVFF